MGRPLRVIQSIYPYHLVCRTNNRTFRFNQREVIRIVFKVIRETQEKYHLLVHHFVLMSNHYHIIATPTEDNLHRAMQYLNSRIAMRFNKAVRRSGHLWGDRYGSSIIDIDDHYLACIRYIYRNPKRAGMVRNLEEFPDSSFNFWAFGKQQEVIISDDHLVLRLNGQKRKIRQYFQTLVLDEHLDIPDEQVKRGLRKRFFGSADFIQRMEGSLKGRIAEEN